MEWSNGSFKPRSPKPLPCLSIKVETMPDVTCSMSEISNPPKRAHTKIQAFADSGCQTCTAGTDLLKSLRYPQAALIPTSHKISGITETNLEILGALPLKFTANGNSARQLVYITNATLGTFLSQSTLIDLGILPSDFPSAIPSSFTNACLGNGVTFRILMLCT